MADNNPDKSEKTEQPTPKRLEDARKKGQVPRSKDLNTFVLLMAGGAAFLVMGSQMFHGLTAMTKDNLTLMDAQRLTVADMLQAFQGSLLHALTTLIPFLGVTFVAALVAPILLGGWSFSMKSVAFKAERISPKKGMGRIFAVRSLVELAKTLAKFCVVFIVALSVFWSFRDRFFALGNQALEPAMSNATSMLLWTFLLVSFGMLLIVLVDVPYQLWDHNKNLKMTRQEVKDEYKKTEGDPHVKARIRSVQREMAERRMMAAVPSADVVITNPTHFAVALCYEPGSVGAPTVVAKGGDFVAMQIRKVANAHDVPMVEVPVLARAIFFTTELECEIPEGLYIAVAQVLAYIYQLNDYQRGLGVKPTLARNIELPQEFVDVANGTGGGQ